MPARGKPIWVPKMLGLRPRARTGVRAVVAALLVSGLLSLQTVPQLSVRLNAPIVGAVHDPAGGYWEVGADGGVFAYDGAGFFGSLPSKKIKVTTPIVGIAPVSNGRGYWLLSENGRVFAFGDARSLGNAQDHAVAIVPYAKGYRVISTLGTSVAFLPKATKLTKSHATKLHITNSAPTTSLATTPSTALTPSAIAPPAIAPPALVPPDTTPAIAPTATTATSSTGGPGGATSGSGTGSGDDNLVPPASLMTNSLFDRDIQSWGLDASSASFAADIVADYKAAYGAVATNLDRPVYWVPANQPLVPITVASGCNNFIPSTGNEAPVPPDAVPGNDSDNILTVYQPSTETAWEFWLAKETNGAWSACWGGKLDMATTDGVFPAPYGETASGLSNLATEITEADIASGSINHAIGIVVLGDACNGYVYPADRGDCGSYPGQPAEGQWFRFPAGLAMPGGLVPFAQMVFKAIQSYGAVVVDQGGAVGLNVDQPSAWAGEGHSGTDPITASMDGLATYQVVASLPWGDLQTVDPPQG